MTFAKVQCMHCLIPSCVSACIVGALTKAPDGAVVYDPTICIGCRYCMVACPFEVPAYESHDALAPEVRKCELCTGTTASGGADPACAAACPTETLVFGKRADLLAIAHQRLEERPDRYVQHVYGEHEVGGTGWLYLTGRPVERDRTAAAAGAGAGAAHRGHPARHLQVRHPPGRALRDARRDHVAQSPARRRPRTTEPPAPPAEHRGEGRRPMSHRPAPSRHQAVLHLRHAHPADPHGDRLLLRHHPPLPRPGLGHQPRQPQPLGHLDRLRRGLRRRPGGRRLSPPPPWSRSSAAGSTGRCCGRRC